MELSAPLSVILAASALDLLLGDPVYRWHPISLLGGFAAYVEQRLFAVGATGRSAGLVYLVAIMASVLILWWGIHQGLAWLHPGLAWCWDVYLAYSLLCLRGLLEQGRRVRRDLANLPAARQHMALLVGRDTAPLNQAGLVRATIESLGENLTDGVVTPLWALCLFGLPGIIGVKVISTLDSMVGYNNARYVRFGWASARADDIIQWLPARASVLLIMAGALLLRLHPRLAWQAAWRYHAMLPSPNSGWSEAAYAGALRVRLVGPVYHAGELVNTAYMGNPAWPAELDAGHLTQALRLTAVCGGLALIVGFGLRVLLGSG